MSKFKIISALSLAGILFAGCNSGEPPVVFVIGNSVLIEPVKKDLQIKKIVLNKGNCELNFLDNHQVVDNVKEVMAELIESGDLVPSEDLLFGGIDYKNKAGRSLLIKTKDGYEIDWGSSLSDFTGANQKLIKSKFPFSIKLGEKELFIANCEIVAVSLQTDQGDFDFKCPDSKCVLE